MSRIEAKKIVKRYAQVLLDNHFPVKEVYLFGSYAHGHANQWSDIDVAVVSDADDKDFIKNEMLLARLSAQVDSRLEPHNFTIEDFSIDIDPFVYEIKKTAIRVI